jgi:hypothetical protein
MLHREVLVGLLQKKHAALKLLLLACLIGSAFSHAAVRAAPAPAQPTTTHHSKKKSKKTRHVVSKRRTPLPAAPDSDRTTQIQSALSRGGYYAGDPSGKWDGDTVVALQKFQSANGLDPKGKLDAPTLQRLGLGSEIAGVSAPRPSGPAVSISSSPNAGSVPSAAPASSAPPAAPSVISRPGISTN